VAPQTARRLAAAGPRHFAYVLREYASTTTATGRTDPSINNHLQDEPLRHPIARTFATSDATASAVSSTNTCRSHDVTGFSAPTGLELAAQRLRVVIVDQDEGLSGRQPRVDAEDARMPATVRDLANVEHLRRVQRAAGEHGLDVL
jgi:hypothetical protein